MYYIAHNLEFLRKKHRLSINDIAEKTSIPKSTIASYAEGRARNPSEENVKKIATLFDIDPSDLLYKNIARFPVSNKDLKGDENHTDKYVDSKRTKHPLPMSTMLAMSIADLLELKKMQEDVEYVKSITDIITYKQECEHLKKENELLRQRITDKEEIIRGYQKK